MLIAVAVHVIVAVLVFVLVRVLVFMLMTMLIVFMLVRVVIIVVRMVIVFFMRVVIVFFVRVFVFVFMRVVIVFVVGVVVIFVPMLIFVFVGVVIVIMRMLIFVVIIFVPMLIFMHVPGSANWDDLDTSRDFHDWRVSGRARDHSEQGFFNAAAVDEDQIGVRQGRQLARARLKCVRVGADRNQRRHFNAIARDVLDDIGKNTVGRHHIELVILCDRAEIGQQQGRQQAKHQSGSLSHVSFVLALIDTKSHYTRRHNFRKT